MFLSMVARVLQVRNLRKMYEDQMRKAQEDWLRHHQAKVGQMKQLRIPDILTF